MSSGRSVYLGAEFSRCEKFFPELFSSEEVELVFGSSIASLPAQDNCTAERTERET